MYFKEYVSADWPDDCTDGLTGAQIKGILKKGGGAMEDVDLNERLMCTVPEHHDLEDYIAQLQKKIKKLKIKLQDEQEMSLEDSKRVLFEEDMEKQTIRRLKEELQDRRQELEGLDLAVERQKSHLNKMKRKEQRMRDKGRAGREETSRSEGVYPRTTHAQRQAFLNREDEWSESDSDYSYDFPAYEGHGKKGQGHREIQRIEETLAKRRAELRATDKILTECELDLADVQHKSKESQQHYQTSRDGYRASVRDLEDMERAARDTDSLVTKEREQLRLVQLECQTLQEERKQHEVTLSDIRKLIANKDAEVTNLDAKIKQATKRLQEIQYEIHSTDGQHRERQTLVKDSDRMVTERRKELQLLQKQIADERLELDKMNQQIGREKAELEGTMESIKTRRGQLESLDKELNGELEQKRKELKDLDRKVGDMHHERKKYNQELKQEELHLDHIQAESRKRAVEVDSLQRQISANHDEVDALLAQKRSLEGSISGLHQEKHTLEDSARDLHAKVGDLKRSHGQMEIDVETRHRQLSSLESMLQRVEQVIDSVSRPRATDMDGMRLHGGRDGRSDHDAFYNHKGSRPGGGLLENDMERAFNELGRTRSELSKNQQELRHVIDKAEGWKRGVSNGSYANLEERLKHVAQEIISRENEKEHLKTALEKSTQELHELHRKTKKERDELGQRVRHLETEGRGLRQELDDRTKELLHLRKKSANDIADLEGIAQAHCSRANRLSDELSYLRAEYLEVKRKVDSQQEIVEREKRLENSIKDLKSDIKYEVADTILDQEKTKQETLDELGELQDQQNNLSNQISTLKQNLALMRSQDSGVFLNTDSLRESIVEPTLLKIHNPDPVVHISTDNSRDSFLEHQTFLKNQLEAKMARQSELLRAQRQISQENILNLQRKVSSVEQAFSQADSGALTPLSDSGPALAKSDLVTVPTADSHHRDNTSQDSAHIPDVPKRAYSPHRYSNSRTARYSTSSDLPEKDASS